MQKLLWLDDFRNTADYVTGDYDIQSSHVVGKDNIRSLMNNWHRVFTAGN